MLTIRFDEEDHHHSAPYFCLPTPQGDQVSLRDFHEKSNLVLMFVPDACNACPQFLQKLSSRSQEFAQENANLLAAFPPGSQLIQELPEFGQILFLEDRGLAVRQMYSELMAPGLVSQEFAQENARLLAAFPPGSQLIQELPEFGQILFLEDRGLAVRRMYGELMAPGLVSQDDLLCFVLDSYGAPYACLAGSRPEPADQDEILSWLRFIGIQCPE